MSSLYERSKAQSRSRAGSTNERVTEVTNGLLVSRPAKEPEITILNDSWDKQSMNLGNGKTAASASDNKMKAIHNFIKSNGRI